jgi:hypothetical protein
MVTRRRPLFPRPVATPRVARRSGPPLKRVPNQVAIKYSAGRERRLSARWPDSVVSRPRKGAEATGHANARCRAIARPVGRRRICEPKLPHTDQAIAPAALCHTTLQRPARQFSSTSHVTMWVCASATKMVRSWQRRLSTRWYARLQKPQRRACLLSVLAGS